jgi:hypothetical protein
MDRRSFLGIAACGLTSGTALAQSCRLDRYLLRNAADAVCIFRTLGRTPALAMEAIVAAHLPQLAVVEHAEAAALVAAPILELRTYRAPAAARLDAILSRASIRPAFWRRTAATRTYLIPFTSLEARGESWNRLTADREWLRVRGRLSVTEIALFRPYDSAALGFRIPSSSRPATCLPRSNASE